MACTDERSNPSSWRPQNVKINRQTRPKLHMNIYEILELVHLLFEMCKGSFNVNHFAISPYLLFWDNLYYSLMNFN